MAILRASDVREKDDVELESHLSELRKNLMKIRGGLASGGIPEDVGKVREIKKTIARILTIQHEKKLGIKREVKKITPAEKKEKAAEKPKEVAEKEKPKQDKTKTTKKISSKKSEEVIAKK